eukprot:TRINITY_DN12826_c0_g1_i1.p1 TRINITY_DN12826_c0_g1~~TRINITY_DN12826_c0_g1_i1.p1  ORF type:complete len:275 (-),score=75.39 TRINITY_DN12826_c0_g1_i1:24-848(-)
MAQPPMYAPQSNQDVYTFDKNIVTTQSLAGANSVVEIQEFKELRGIQGDPNLLHHYKSIGLRLKRIRVTLNNGQMKAESGALHYKKGAIELDVKTGGVGGLLKKAVSSAVTEESVFKPTYTGTGEVYLEPSWGYYMLVHLNNEEAIVDKGLYYASEGGIEVGAYRNKNVSSALFGGEGIYQTRVKGTGWVVLTIPVSPEEVQKFTLTNEKLSVDGTFAILRKGHVDFTVEKSTKSFFGSKASGEGLLQTFTGTGEVWLCPTLDWYPQPPYPRTH